MRQDRIVQYPLEFSLGHHWPLEERVSTRIDGANFRGAVFEWSMCIVAIDTSGGKKVKAPREKRTFSFARDWRGRAHLSLRHVSAIAAVRTSFPFAADRVDQTLGTPPFSQLFVINRSTHELVGVCLVVVLHERNDPSSLRPYALFCSHPLGSVCDCRC